MKFYRRYHHVMFVMFPGTTFLLTSVISRSDRTVIDELQSSLQCTPIYPEDNETKGTFELDVFASFPIRRDTPFDAFLLMTAVDMTSASSSHIMFEHGVYLRDALLMDTIFERTLTARSGGAPSIASERHVIKGLDRMDNKIVVRVDPKSFRCTLTGCLT